MCSSNTVTCHNHSPFFMFTSMNESMRALSLSLPSSVTKRRFGKYEESKIHLENGIYLWWGKENPRVDADT